MTTRSESIGPARSRCDISTECAGYPGLVSSILDRRIESATRELPGSNRSAATEMCQDDGLLLKGLEPGKVLS